MRPRFDFGGSHTGGGNENVWNVGLSSRAIIKVDLINASK